MAHLSKLGVGGYLAQDKRIKRLGRINGRLEVNRPGFGNFAHSGRRDDPLRKYLTPGLTKGDNPKPAFPSHKDGAYFVFNQEWERVFQKQPGDPDDKLQKLVSHGRGKHGLILAHGWAEHYAAVAEPDERNLIQLRVQTLLI
ncbi:hypothetical protein B0H19DRAFT_1251081 [Mycena capillaripes]|nr:hypothetical protein B0H19DRAFT_1251081 [Mycena capillaripes]